MASSPLGDLAGGVGATVNSAASVPQSELAGLLAAFNAIRNPGASGGGGGSAPGNPRSTPPSNIAPPQVVPPDVSPQLQSLSDQVGAALKHLTDSLGGTLGNIVSGIASSVTGAVGATQTGLNTASQTIADALNGNIMQSFNTIKDALTPLAQDVQSGLSFSLDSLNNIVGAIQTQSDGVANGIAKLRDDFTAAVGSRLNDLTGGIDDLTTKIGNTLNDTTDAIKEKLGDAAKNLGDTIANITDGIKQGFDDFGKVFQPALTQLAVDIGIQFWLALVTGEVPASVMASLPGMKGGS